MAKCFCVVADYKPKAAEVFKGGVMVIIMFYSLFIFSLAIWLAKISRYNSHLSFLDFVVYVVMTLIFPTNQRKRASSTKNVAILLLLFKWAITAPNKLIASQHYKRHRKHGKSQKSRTKIIFQIGTQSPRYPQRTLFIQLIYFCFSGTSP